MKEKVAKLTCVKTYTIHTTKGTVNKVKPLLQIGNLYMQPRIDIEYSHINEEKRGNYKGRNTTTTVDKGSGSQIPGEDIHMVINK